MATATDRGVPLSTLCPKFLHTNSTSHTWPFSAIAELIDNAYDPDVEAKQLWIDKTIIKGQECLSFMDNGNGLDHETMHKMLSFGYSDKTAANGVQPIGIYGNGFKSGSMRLGRDAIVFSKSKTISCVGMLSQTYLEQIDAKQIIVPIVCFEQREPNQFSAKEEHRASLEDILRYSPFTIQDLINELKAITHCTENTGTRIIIWNLRRITDGKLEFDFEKDRYDIQIPNYVHETMTNTNLNPNKAISYIPPSVYSLRAYCSILYLKPRMQIVICSQKVKSQLIAKSLALIRKDNYKPNFLHKEKIPITFGYNTKSRDQYGIMMYHKNRLIKAYERVGCQLKANNQGVGVIGIIECNFLDPTHNKQDFIESDKYRKTMTSLGIKLEEYWKESRYTWDKDHPNTSFEDATKRPDQNWVQCDACLHWRKLSDGINCNKLPSKWFCHMNTDPQFRDCSVEEEPEDSEEEQATYRKTYKLKERENKKQQEEERQREERERRLQEEQRFANLAKEKEDLKQKHEKLKRQLRQTTCNSLATSRTPTSTFGNESLPAGAARGESPRLRSSAIPEAACSPSSYSGLPVITSVCSLSPGHLRGKRTKLVSPQTTPKRLKVNNFQRNQEDKPSSVNVTPLSSPSVHNGDGDDDIVILETISTPKPKAPVLDLNKVKTEQGQSDADVNMMLECNDDAAEENLETNALGKNSTGLPDVATSPSPAPPPGIASATTQTEMFQVKKEEEDQNQSEERAGQSTANKDAVCANREKVTSLNGLTHHPESDEAADACTKKYSSPHQPSIIDIQEQQDQLLELMQVTAQERDSFKEEVCKLTSQLKEMQKRLHRLSQISVKESSHQASQAEETVETQRGEGYKIQFEKAKQKVDELTEDKEALLAATNSKASNDPGEEKDIDCLLRVLEQTKKEKDELRAKLDTVADERANLASQCEELRLSLQQQRENKQEANTTPQAATDSSVQTDPEDARGTADPGTDSNADTLRCLIELRQSVGRLLIRDVPALDLDQVNFESNVIDEILEQIVLDRLLSESALRQEDET